MMIVNSYNIFDPQHDEVYLYHAVATDLQQVQQLAHDKGYDLEGMVIELDRKDVRDESHRPYTPFIVDSQP